MPLYLICQANLSANPNGVETNSLRSPVLGKLLSTLTTQAW